MINVGDILNQRYKIQRLIGSGGSAHVYLALDLILDRNVAVKVLRRDFTHEEKALKRFQREAKAISFLTHQNIVNLYDVDEDNSFQYLVMEYIDGIDLRKYIQKNHPISKETIVDIMKQIADAISHAHKQGVIHRDLKTQNIIIRKDGVVKITDFGIATSFNDISVTQTNTLVGSIHYLSPEQARGERATHQSDIYALGIILYEMIMGSVPFKGDTPVSIAMQHFQSSIPSIVGRSSQEIPQSLENIVLKSTAKNPMYRYQTCDELFQDLMTCLHKSKQSLPKFIEPNRPTVQKQSVNKPQQVSQPVLTPKEKPKRKIPLGMLLTGIGALALLIVTLLITLTPKAGLSMPDLRNKEQEQAVQLLSDMGIVVENVVEEQHETVKPGRIIRTNPNHGERLNKQDSVTLYVSSGNGTIKVEDYSEKEYAAIYPELIEKGLIIERRTETSSTVEAGHVISQSITAGANVAKGTVLTLTVSSGAVPFGNYVNQNGQVAKQQLEDLGFVVTIEEETNSQVSVGTVIRQSIEPGTKVDSQQTKDVTLTVSKGVTMPDFSGWNEQAIFNRLSEMGLTASFYIQESNTVPRNEMISQSVKPGTPITSRTDIVITISSGSSRRTSSTQEDESSTQETESSTTTTTENVEE